VQHACNTRGVRLRARWPPGVVDKWCAKAALISRHQIRITNPAADQDQSG